MILKVAALILSFFLAGGLASAQDLPKVLSFTPQGTVKSIRQARAAFSEAMVPFGDQRIALAPFDISSPEKGTGRWVDPKNWVFDFDQDLPAGIRCSFRLRPDLRTLAGKELKGKRDFSFSTGGPAIKVSTPYEGSRISDDQIFLLQLDAAPDEDSLLRNVGFDVSGIKERLGIRRVTGEELEVIIKAHPWLSYGKIDQSRIILLQCRQRFPAKSRVTLVWGKGVMSASGVATLQDQVLPFETREMFSAEFTCDRENPQGPCIPVLPMHLRFSAPLDPQEGAEAILRGPGGKIWKAPLNKDSTVVSFEGPFPEKGEFILELPPDLKDDAGRVLVNADKFPLKVRTANYPPLAKFSARFGILELKASPVLPVTVRNIEPELRARVLKVKETERGIAGRVMGKIFNIPPDRVEDVQPWLRRVASAHRDTSLFSADEALQEFTLSHAKADALQVVGIPLNKPGLYVVELKSAILGKALLDPPKPMFVFTAVLVTNLSVHFKQGRESSLVWVTTLDKGTPVGKAAVTVMNCEGKVLWKGRTDASGMALIPSELPDSMEIKSCQFKLAPFDSSQLGALRGLDHGFFVTAQTGDDMSFVHSTWNQGIEAWRFNLPSSYALSPVIAHTIFDRTLLRAGESIHMKHILRRHTPNGFGPIAPEGLPDTVSIRHEGSRQVYEFPLRWDGTAAAETDWVIPRDAKPGTYEVTLVRKAGLDQEREEAPAPEGEGDGAEPGENGPWASGRFRVEEFRVPLLKGTLVPPAAPLVKAQEATVDMSVHYLAGGGASLLPVRVRSQVSPRRIQPFTGYEEFTFANGGVKEGISRREQPYDVEGEGEVLEGALRPRAMDLVLDAAGCGRAVINGLPSHDRPQEILTELEFRDPNGEVQTVSTRIPLWNARCLVGIKPDAWAVSKDGLSFTVAVVDLSGRPVVEAPVRVELFQRKVLSHRKRLTGGFYAYEHTVETRRIATLLEGKTDQRGLLFAKSESPLSGELILLAESMDDAGNRSMANQSVWMAGKGDWWFETSDHDRMDLIPERKRYEPGETAVFQVRMPFREATALIAVEREGVIDARVQQISGQRPIIEVPLKGHYAPNVFVSVLAVRGRTGEVQPTAMADLGKPAFRLGVAEIHVGWAGHELKVTVTTDKPRYKVREKARVRVRAMTADGKMPPPGGEVALVAVDEGLLELMSNRSWDLLSAMMKRRGYEVQTATAQMQVVGKRHFGVKALPQGGGGGRQITRELFDTLLLWKGRVPLNPKGEAEVEVPLNDSISGFRIVAIATAGNDLFGTGAASIQSTQDLMVLPGLSPTVRQGDRFRAGVTVRNASNRAMTVAVSAEVQGLEETPPAQTAHLLPGESREIGWDVTVPAGLDALTWQIDAGAAETGDRDRVRVVQKVLPAVPLRVIQASIAQADPEFRLPVEKPPEALSSGGVRVSLRPNLHSGLDGVRQAMRQYPYGCLEQRISRAVALGERSLWDRHMEDLPAYTDSDGLVKYFPSMTHGDPVLTAYLMAIGHEAGFVIPPEPFKGMALGLKAFVEGRLLRTPPLPTADLTLRKLSALEALSRIGQADPKMLQSISIEPNLWPTSAVMDWISILLNLDKLPARKERLFEADQILRARLTFHGSVLTFSTETTDRLWWLMVSNDVNAARLILTALRLEGWSQDLPRLVQGTLARQRGGRWDLTTANAWGVLAMKRFSEAFEREKVSGITRETLAKETQIVDWAASPHGETRLMPWPGEKSEFSALHQGHGKPWVTVQGLAAIPLKDPVSSGYTLRKSLLPMDRKRPDQWSRGDTLRVRLDFKTHADMTWVVVEDPIPAGATILGTGLGRDSRILTRGEEKKGRVWPAYEERSFDAYRAYYEIAPAGTWSVEYTMRLNQSGVFHLPPSRVEALYAPEMFGEIPNGVFEVNAHGQ